MNFNDQYYKEKKTLHNSCCQENLDSEIISKCINGMFKAINGCNEGLTGREVINYILLDNLELTRLTRKMIVRYLNEDNLNIYLKSLYMSCYKQVKTNLNKNVK